MKNFDKYLRHLNTVKLQKVALSPLEKRQQAQGGRNSVEINRIRSWCVNPPRPGMLMKLDDTYQTQNRCLAIDSHTKNVYTLPQKSLVMLIDEKPFGLQMNKVLVLFGEKVLEVSIGILDKHDVVKDE